LNARVDAPCILEITDLPGLDIVHWRAAGRTPLKAE
jgi:hypothetical protein